MPLFSIITVCFNAEHTIAPTLASVAEQTFTDFEYIVKDGGSTDSTVRLATEAGIAQARIISERDRGIYDAMNSAMSVARGEYLIFLNAGDSFASPRTLQLMADAISANGRPGIVYGHTMAVDADRHILGPRHLQAPRQLTLQSFASGMLVCHQAMAVLAKIADRYDTRFRYSADYLWAIHCLQHSRCNVMVEQEPLIHYLSEGTTTRHRYSSLLERFRIMCRYYGTLPTLWRHITFVWRSLRRGSIG